MEEQDLHLQFAEKKEALVTGYFKKMDSLLAEEEEEEKDKKNKEKKKAGKTPEEIKKIMKVHEKKFLEESIVLREKFHKKVLKFREKEKKKQQLKENLKKSISPLVFLWELTKNGSIKTFRAIKLAIKKGRFFYFEHYGARKQREKHLKKLMRENKLHPRKVFFYEHIWPILHFLNSPTRKLKVMFGKAKDRAKEIFKKTVEVTRKGIEAAVKFVTETFGKVTEKITGFIDGIKDIIGKTIAYLKRVWDVFRVKVLRIKDE